MATGGYIQLYRSMIDWEWYKNTNTKSVFIHLLLKANHADARWQGTDIKAGQLVVSSDGLAKELGLTRQNIRTALVHLKSTNEITIQSTNKYMLVTLENWASYQTGYKESTNKPTISPTINQPTANQQLTTNNKNNKNKKKKNIYSAEKEVDSVVEFEVQGGSSVWMCKWYVDELDDLHDDVDVYSNFEKMAKWLHDHPSGRKTKQGLQRFVETWMSKDYNKLPYGVAKKSNKPVELLPIPPEQIPPPQGTEEDRQAMLRLYESFGDLCSE